MSNKTILTTLLVTLISLTVEGHFRGGKKITRDGVEVDLLTLSLAQLESIDRDPQILRPEGWADAYALAKDHLGAPSEPRGNLSYIKEIEDLKAANADLRIQLDNATAQIADLTKPAETSAKTK